MTTSEQDATDPTVRTDDVADPEQIQREIEATRAELAATVEKIADRVSPKKVMARSTEAAKNKALVVGLNTYVKLENTFAPNPPGATEPVPLKQRIKWERVAAVVGGIVGFIALLVKLRHHEEEPPPPTTAELTRAALKARSKAAERATKEASRQAWENASKKAAKTSATTSARAAKAAKKAKKQAKKTRTEVGKAAHRATGAAHDAALEAAHRVTHG